MWLRLLLIFSLATFIIGVISWAIGSIKKTATIGSATWQTGDNLWALGSFLMVVGFVCFLVWLYKN